MILEAALSVKNENVCLPLLNNFGQAEVIIGVYKVIKVLRDVKKKNTNIIHIWAKGY